MSADDERAHRAVGAGVFGELIAELDAQCRLAAGITK